MSDLHSRARKVIPGGVSSPARSFGYVGGDPIFAASGEGAHLVDTEGRRYIDYIQGFGSLILGHGAIGSVPADVFGLSTPHEVDLAELVVSSISSIERVRFVASGTEASMTAARIARAATDRTVLVKFEGCYHGHADAFLAKAGSGVATFSVPMAKGVPPSGVSDTVVLAYNDADALRGLFEERGRELAAVFVEPIAANMGVVPPRPGFLQLLVDLAREHGTITVFDEVVTGFRVGEGGAQELYGLRPDLTMLGKVLGGGQPIGAVGGRADLLDLLAPEGPVYQAGTYAAHPQAMTAGVAVLSRLSPHAFAALEATASRLADGLARVAKDAGADVSVVRAETLVSVFFCADPPSDFSDVQACDTEAFARFHRLLRDEGVLIAPSPYEAWFPSLAHTTDELDATVEAARKAFSLR